MDIRTLFSIEMTKWQEDDSGGITTFFMNRLRLLTFLQKKISFSNKYPRGYRGKKISVSLLLKYLYLPWQIEIAHHVLTNNACFWIVFALWALIWDAGIPVGCWSSLFFSAISLCHLPDQGGLGGGAMFITFSFSVARGINILLAFHHGFHLVACLFAS